jgi:hypothetical protein
MGKERVKDLPYEPAFLAEKHGLTLEAAKVIITANGPSRLACDASAKFFAEAVAARHRQWMRD